MMTPERWAAVTEIFEAALELDAAARPAWLNQRCGADADLRVHVDSLLASHEEAELDSGRWTAPLDAFEEDTSTIGPYCVLGNLGSGGMAEVFRVKDQRLGREVALKMLLPELAGDAEFVERFRREARAASVLEHPNICRLYDIGEWKGRPYLTMELLEGQTLRKRMQAGRMGLNEILTIGMEAADALGAAHARGFVHRDIKPANIFLSTTGHVKVLDFGLAKRTKAARKLAPEEITLTNRHTIPGTPSYMSPEQILGEDADVRTDTFALGIVLYEMATGCTAFPGEGTADVFRKILAETPLAPSLRQPNTSAELDRIIMRALEKDRDLRYQSALDLRAELKRLMRQSDAGRQETIRPRARVNRKTRLWMAGAAAVVLLLSLVGWFTRSVQEQSPRVMPAESSAGLKESPAFSPSGEKLAYSWIPEGQTIPSVFVKLVETGTAVRISRSNSREGNPVWSPDGNYIAFQRLDGPDAGYYVAGSLGGGERKVADVFSPPIQMGGRNLDWSPDGAALAIADSISAGAPVSIFTVSIQTREKKNLIEGGPFLSNPVYSPDGKKIAYAKGPSYLATDIYVRSTSGGEALPVTKDQRWIAGLTWAFQGRELIFSSNRAGLYSLWRVDARGGEPALVAAAGPDAYSPSVSTDGKRLAYTHRRMNLNIWRIPTDGSEPAEKLVRSSRLSMQPDYSPNGRRIVFTSDRSGTWEIWITDADGGNAGKITSIGGGQTGAPKWSPDGRWIAFDARPAGQAGIYVVAADGNALRRVTKSESADDFLPAWSRDGRQLYFISDRSGRAEVWRIAVEGGEAVQVTTKGAEYGIESEDGESLYYARQGELWRKSLRDGMETKLAADLAGRDLLRGPDGVYFVPKNGSLSPSVERILAEDGRRENVLREVGPAADRVGAMALSPDGKWLLFERVDQSDSEVMVVTGLR